MSTEGTAPRLPPYARFAVVVSDNGAGGYLEDFRQFAVAVTERLRKGEETYRGYSFSAEPRALVEEIRNELRDVAGWAFLLDCRLARVADELSVLHSLDLEKPAS
jgi:hypothetical protein